MIKNNNFYIKLIFIVLITFILSYITYIFINNGKNQENVNTDSVRKIKDEERGILFNAPQGFESMGDIEVLQAINQSLIYGFESKDNPNVLCRITQTQIEKSGNITSDYLKDGTFKQVQQNHSDAILNDWKKIVINNNNGSILDISYSENNTSTRLLEFVATTQKRTTFAFCLCPESLYEYYGPKFESFLDSIEIW